MESLQSAARESMRGNLPGHLSERLVQSVTETCTTEQALPTLADLHPAEVASWMLTDERTARALCSEDALAGLLSKVVDAALARSPDTQALHLTELVQCYADVVTADTVAALVSWLPTELREGGIRQVVSAALEREPLHAGVLRAAIDMALRAGTAPEAHRLLTRLGRADNSQANLHYVWRKRAALPPSGDLPVRAALMSSFTVDPLLHYLDIECRILGLDPQLYASPFNSWAQEVLGEESSLRRFEPEIAFLSVSIDDLIPELAGAPPAAELHRAGETAVERVLAVARQFATWSDGVLVVHSFHSTFRDPQGILACHAEPSRAVWLAKLNAQLAQGLKTLPRTYLLNVTDLLLRRPGGALDNAKMRHLAAMRFCGPVLSELAHAYASFIAPLKGLTRKCVVLDLDNTLWGGIVGEDGAQGIKLGNTSPGSEYQEFQRCLLSLTARGFLLAINSKNNPEDALEVIRNHEGMILREEAFSAIRVNWRPKPENMLSIAEELNIGVDSMVFLDDNPNERELMRQTLPQVLTPELPADPSLYRATVEALPQLQKLVITETDRTRAEQYRAKRQREDTRMSAQSLEDYLHSLEIAVEIGHADESNLPRVHQLFERTNQFNLTTHRYPAGELERLAADPDWRLYTLEARDRFGDHGLVATALVRAAAKRWTLDSFLMSCRVIGYGVETALLAAVSDDARAAGATQLVGEYIESPKNAPARDFYQRHGFAELESADGVMRWRLALTEQPTICPTWIAIQSHNDA